MKIKRKMLQKAVSEAGGFMEVLLSCGMAYAKLISYLAFRTMEPVLKCFIQEMRKKSFAVEISWQVWTAVSSIFGSH